MLGLPSTAGEKAFSFADQTEAWMAIDHYLRDDSSNFKVLFADHVGKWKEDTAHAQIKFNWPATPPNNTKWRFLINKAAPEF